MQGCDGGLASVAMLYVRDNHGIDGEKDYHYEGVESICRFNRTEVRATDVGIRKLPSGDEEALKVAVATKGPVAVAIDASNMSFQLYDSGVYYEPCCNSAAEGLDHAVLVVGYGRDEKSGEDYWLVKNSWGKRWGENG